MPIRILMLTLAMTTGAAAAELRGTARVVDGDSLVVEDVRVRLHAIDAPEMREPLGARAKLELERIVGRRPVVCETSGRDRHGNAVATCRQGRRDIAGELVGRGWARAWPRYGRDYLGEEAAARAAGRGMWAPGLEGARRSARHPE